MAEFRNGSTEALSIDLKSSPASRFLVQIVPREFQLSPLSPFARAAVPFAWEESPGKPKIGSTDSDQIVQQFIPFLQPPYGRRSCSGRDSFQSIPKSLLENEHLVANGCAGKLAIQRAESRKKRARWIPGGKIRKTSQFFTVIFKSIWRSLLCGGSEFTCRTRGK